MNNIQRDLLRFLKKSSSTSWPQLSLAINEFKGYYLRIIPTNIEYLDELDIIFLTNLRNRYVKSFLTEFVANDHQTANWLANTVHADDTRILFMVENEFHDRLGYMGLAYIDWEKSYVEADAIVSGGFTPKGLMASSLRTLLLWAKHQLSLENVGVRVLSDNPALSFYKKIGFEENKRVPLRSTSSGTSIEWVEDISLTTPDRYLVHHFWNELQTKS